ncbi:transcriptional activator DEMETER-like [Pistacia vera]|uniref:transcriptional activator DEMETER-like n=1 Tax=Pistacia vera TaxID=55513 RepID=UPI0012636791|nr:transcriptional activator DEMETER-like [Pistacia vera]
MMLQIETQQSPGITNESKCNNCTIFIEPGQAWRSKRKYSNAVEHAEASNSNLIGIEYNTLQAYQNPWVPKIHKKKRTEKGQNSSTSSTSSSVTAAKDVTLETTCYQDDTKANPSVSKINNSVSTPQWNAGGIATLGEARSNLQDKQKTFEGILALTPTESVTKKRSKGLTRVRDLASLTRLAECGMQPTYPGNQGQLDCDMQQVGNPQRPHTCIEALVAEVRETLARKKRTKKRNSFFNSASTSTNEAQKQQKFILYNHLQFSLGALPELTWTRMISIDELTEQLEKLDINRESSNIDHQEQNALVPYSMRYQEQNALVIYNRDGTVVPFHGSFELVKKRRPRPKVDLDEETNRVWKLLLENINSQGIDGTDEENTKWWEEERRVFHGRVDSFIARMHLVQGDRRFSKWKGSVVDSVVGVFLTQNVSDHLSSSAFMSLAAHFPLKSKDQKPCYGEGTSSVTEEQAVYILDPEETVEWTEKMSNQPACDQSSMTLHNTEINEEKEVISSNESFGNSCTVNSIDESKCKLLNSCVSDSETCYDTILNRSTTESTATETICSVGGRIATDYLLSSQNSMDSSIAENAERTKSSFDNNSEAADLTRGSALNSFNECTSFVELLQMAGSYKLHKVYNHGDVNISSDENSKHESDQFQTMAYDSPRQKVEDLNSPKDFLGESNIPPSTFHPYLTQDSAVEVACYEMLGEETGSSGISVKNNKEGVVEQIAVTPELTSQTKDTTKLTISVQEAPSSSSETKQASNSMQEDQNLSEQHQSELSRDSTVVELLAKGQKHEMQHQNLSNLSGETQGATESNNACDNRENIQPNTSVSDLNKHDHVFGKELNEINDATSKAKGRKVAKDKKKDFDWDSLRRQVEVNGRKERPENNMDSLDWEAVRCADVNKIANTIKERGMNNMLAERIKDFLNRIVREHGGIDLEWLRDVPPDKAKEYLLSIRGLGLKSVECVRLLTLHHLAFPVDTNVGRIAVRLGWVPLQPLPESLQLHLLELYPVLESIQKYLWPRLCKLDQRTLYELHYQMITFGKVFCTKSKPNCNACPMRGECRHFASAFASSRLALPGPEERSIVSAKANITSDQNPEVIINKLPLPLPQAMDQPEGNQQSEAILEANNCEPIIEEPATPEPECPQVTETDMEDTFCEDPDEIPTIKLNMEEFSQTLQNYVQENMELQEGDMSKALVALKAEVASIPTPKLKNVSRLRTEHQVYELPDSHPLLEGLEKREPDDPGRYLLAVWTPGEMPNSIQPPEWRCSSQENGKLCDEKTCFSCNSVRESQSHIVRGTLLIPCRTAMRGSFPLNGTYFQVNEVFADHDSSLNPINVPREWLWNLPRRTVFFGTSIPTIFKGLTTEGIQHCFWRGM